MPLSSPDITANKPKVEQDVHKPNVEPQSSKPQGKPEADMVKIIDSNASNPDVALREIADVPQKAEDTEETKGTKNDLDELSDKYTGFDLEDTTSKDVYAEELRTFFVSAKDKIDALIEKGSEDTFGALGDIASIMQKSRDMGHEDLYFELINFVKDHEKQLEQHVKTSGDSGIVGQSFRLVDLASIETIEDAEWGMNFMTRNLDVIKKLNQDGEVVVAMDALAIAITRGEELKDTPNGDVGYKKVQELASEMILGSGEGLDYDGISQKLKLLLRYSDPLGSQTYLMPEVQKILGTVTERLGMGDGKVFGETLNSSRNIGLEIENYLQVAKEIEEKRPGISKTLYDSFGLRQLQRYSADFLIDMYDNKDKNDLPYGIILTADKDKEGAFSRGQKNMEQVAQNLKGKYYVRALEADNYRDIVKKLIHLDRRYGSDEKISFMIVRAHGSGSAIELGRGLGSLLTQETLKRDSGFAKSIFTEHPFVLFESCSTGAEQGIAQDVSKVLGAKVVAPSRDVVTYGITPVLQNEQVELVPRYDTDNMFGVGDPKLIRVFDKGEFIGGAEQLAA